jgi:hypothetical protein
LQQCLGDRQDAFTVEHLACTEPQLLDLARELHFHRRTLRASRTCVHTIGFLLLIRPVNQTAHFDLNLLRVFHAVHNARNVRRAAELLGLSQPAVSHSLTRLRLALKDPLFVRTAGGVAPTAKAEHFARFVEAALKTIDLALVETGRFDPRPLRAPVCHAHERPGRR